MKGGRGRKTVTIAEYHLFISHELQQRRRLSPPSPLLNPRHPLFLLDTFETPWMAASNLGGSYPRRGLNNIYQPNAQVDMPNDYQISNKFC